MVFFNSRISPLTSAVIFFDKSNLHHIAGLRPFGAILEVKLHLLTLDQRTEALT